MESFAIALKIFEHPYFFQLCLSLSFFGADLNALSDSLSLILSLCPFPVHPSLSVGCI